MTNKKEPPQPNFGGLDNSAIDWLDEPTTWKEMAKAKMDQADKAKLYNRYLSAVGIHPALKSACQVAKVTPQTKKKKKKTPVVTPALVEPGVVDCLMMIHGDKDPWDD